MKRPVIYVAHPLSPTADEIVKSPAGLGWVGRTSADAVLIQWLIDRNIGRALRWLAWLRKTFPAVTFIAPWIAAIQSLHGDDSPELREAGLVDDCTVVRLCAGIVLVGGRISSEMQREAEAMWLCARHDFTWLGDEPPIDNGPAWLAEEVW